MDSPILYSFNTLLPQQSALDNYIRSASQECLESVQYDWDSMNRGNEIFAVLQHTLEGGGRLIFENVEYLLEAGDMMMVLVPGNSRYHFDGRYPFWRFFYFVVGGSEVLRLISEAIRSIGPVMRFQEGNARFKRISQIYSELIASSAMDVATLSTRAYELAALLYQESVTSKGEASLPSDIQQVLRYIQDHYTRELQVAELASLIKLSRYHFSRYFRKHTGASPGDFIIQTRLQASLPLLFARDKSIKELSYKTGFQDANYFIRSFKKRYGMTPGQYQTTLVDL